MWILGLKGLKELCHEIHQNPNSRNATKLSETKISAQNIKGRYKEHSKYKRRHGWTNLKKIETDWKHVSVTVFHSSF